MHGKVFFFLCSFLFLFLVISTGTPCLAQFTPLLLVWRISKLRVCTKLLRAFNNLRLLKSAEERRKGYLDKAESRSQSVYTCELWYFDQKDLISANKSIVFYIA